MNKISGTAPISNQMPYAQPVKSKSKAENADFQEMLSSAMKTGKSGDAQTAKHLSRTQPKADKAKEAAKPQDEADNGENNAMIQAFAQPQTQPQQDTVETEEAQAEVQPVQAEPLRAVQLEAGQAQQQIQAPQTETQPMQQAQSQTNAGAIVQAAATGAEVADELAAVNTDTGIGAGEVMVQQVVHSEAQMARPQYRAIDRPGAQERFDEMLAKASQELGKGMAIPEAQGVEQTVQLSDTVAPELIVGESVQPENIVVESAQPENIVVESAQPENIVVEPAQPENIAETVQPENIVETVQPENAAETEGTEVIAESVQPEDATETGGTEVLPESVQPEDATETGGTEALPESVQPEDATETGDAEVKGDTKAPVKDEDVPEQKTAPRANVIRSETAPRTEQRPLKEMPKTDEAALGMVSNREPEVYVREPVAQPAETTAPQVRTPDQAEQIRVQVIENIETQKMEFQMQLRPQELGKVDVKMILEGGKLAVQITAANSNAVDVLSKQAESLLASLRTANIAVESVTIVMASDNVSGNMDSQYNPSNFQNQTNAHRGQGGGNTGSRAGTGRDAPQSEDGEAPAQETPQRILNYTV